MADSYGVNPLAETLADQNPARFAAKATVTQPPKMFANGTADVPAFTRSGIDPQTLLRLPFGMRHAAAENPDLHEVYRWFETYSDMPDATIDSEGLRAAQSRIEQWERETADPRAAEVIDTELQAEYDQYVRSRSADGLLPEEREQARRDQWEAKQATDAEQANATWVRAAERRDQAWQALQQAKPSVPW